MELELCNLSYSIKDKIIINEVNLTFTPMVTAILGPNGAGKSTIIQAICGLIKPRGTIFYNSRKVDKHNTEFYKTTLSFLPQSSPKNVSLTVFEVILLGLVSSLSLKVTNEQLIKVNDIMEELKISHLAKQELYHLSGGERQIVYLAQALIKAPEILILDEPLNNLDIYNQFKILNLIKKITAERKIITIIVMHDLNIAAKYAENIVIINRGKVQVTGKPCDVILPKNIYNIYRVNSQVELNEDNLPIVELLGI